MRWAGNSMECLKTGDHEILTLEVSGIALAFAAAVYFKCPSCLPNHNP